MNVGVFVSLLTEAVSKKSDILKSDLFKDKLAQTACKAAIKGGDDIPLEEINELISGVLNENHVLVCPHGRPIVIKISEKEIEKWFKRIV